MINIEIKINCPQTKQTHDFNKGKTVSIVSGQLQHSKALISELLISLLNNGSLLG